MCQSPQKVGFMLSLPPFFWLYPQTSLEAGHVAMSCREPTFPSCRIKYTHLKC